MELTQHQIEIATSVERAFAVCRDVERWPALFPPCRAATIVEQQDSRQLIEVAAEANGELFAWRSRRRLYERAGVITFEQVTPAPLLARMEGAWRFFEAGDGVLVALEHRFEVKQDVDGLVPGVADAADAVAFMTRSVEENSRRELRAMKDALEAPEEDSALRAAFEDELELPAPPAAIFALLRDARQWPALLPHCRHVDIRYDDGIDQEFVMTVTVNGRDEQIRTVRHCVEPRRITYFQPEPPPALAAHRGEWRLEPTAAGTLVVSRHAVDIRPDAWGDVAVHDARQRVVQAISKSSRATMSAIGKTLEEGAGDAER